MRHLAVGFCLALASPLAAQSPAVELLVIDDATDAALPGVSVSIAGQQGERVTDQRGRLVYSSARPGKVIFLLRRLGYTPGTLTADATAGDTTRVTFSMTAVPQTLSTVAVRDTANSLSPFLGGFDRRLANHSGSATFITRDEIEKRDPYQTTDILRRVTSISIADSVGVLMPVSRRTQTRPALRSAAEWRGLPGAGSRQLSPPGGCGRPAQGVGLSSEFDSAKGNSRNRDLPRRPRLFPPSTRACAAMPTAG